MIQRICLIIKSNLYDTKRYYAVKFTEALERAGIAVLTLDAGSQPLTGEHYQQLQSFRPQLTCSFNSILPMDSGKFMWDLLRTPHWLINLDPVIYVLHLCESPFSLLSTVDRKDLAFIQEEDAFPNSFFFPHAVERDLEAPENQERPYDVVMIGSFYDHEGVRKTWPERFPPEVCAIMEEAVDRVLSDHCTCFLEATYSAFEERSIDPSLYNFLDVSFCVDYYLRGRDRYELMAAVKDAELHIFGQVHCETVYGAQGWQDIFSTHKNIHIHKPCSFETSMELVAKSKICLNSVPSFKDGWHVRIPSALGLGSLPVTNDNLFMRREFENGKDIILYQHKKWEEVNAQINAFLSDENKRAEAAAKGREKVMAQHTWDHRVATMQEHLPPMLERIRSRTLSLD